MEVFRSVRCWGCLLKRQCTVNIQNISNVAFSFAININDWGICEGCYILVICLLRDRVLPGTFGARFIIDWCRGFPLNRGSALGPIVEWKTSLRYSPTIFTSMCKFWITPYMLQHYSLEELKKHCLEMVIGDTSKWPFFKKLESCPPQNMRSFLTVKKIGPNTSLEYEEYANSLNLDHVKLLTKYVFEYDHGNLVFALY